MGGCNKFCNCAVAGKSKEKDTKVLWRIARDKLKQVAARTCIANFTGAQRQERAAKQKQAKLQPSAIATAKAREKLPCTRLICKVWKKNTKAIISETGKQYYLNNKAVFKAYAAKRATEDPAWITTLKRIILARCNFRKNNKGNLFKMFAKYKTSKMATFLKRYAALKSMVRTGSA